jgi:hypothetical protein
MKIINFCLIALIFLASCNPLDSILKSDSSENKSRSVSSSSTSRTNSTSTTAIFSPSSSETSVDPVADFADSVARTECSGDFDASCVSEVILSDEEKIEELKKTIALDSRPELLAIMNKKNRIMRVSESLLNDYFNIDHTHPYVSKPERMIESEVEVPIHGYHIITPKTGYEYLSTSLPPYVIFHEEILIDQLKNERDYKEIWVDKNNSNCFEKELTWVDSSTSDISKSYIEIISNPETPACSLNVAIKSFCPQGAKIGLNNPRDLKKIIIQIREGEYEEAGNLQLCSGVVIKNYNNENVTFKNLPGSTSHLLSANINERSKIFMSQIHIAGIKFDLRSSNYGMIFYGNPSGDPSLEEYQYRMDGIEVSSQGTIFLKDAYNSEIKNSLFYDIQTPVYIFELEPGLRVRNNTFHHIAKLAAYLFPKNKMTYSDFIESEEPKYEHYSSFSWNNFYKSAGISGINVTNLNLSYNYWTESYQSQLFYGMGVSQNILFSNNLYENNPQIPFYFIGRSGFGFHIKNLIVKENQIINTPSSESNIGNSFLMLENVNTYYFGTHCEDVSLEKNLFLDMGPNVTSINMPTTCTNSRIYRNLFSHSSPSTKSTLNLGGNLAGLRNFEIKENIILGNILVTINPKAGVGVGDSLEKFKLSFDNFLSYCISKNASDYPFFGEIGVCEKQAEVRRDLFYLEDRDKSINQTFAELTSENFNLMDNLIGQYQVRDTTGKKFLELSKNPSKEEYLEVKASPNEETYFEYSNDLSLPDYWNEH